MSETNNAAPSQPEASAQTSVGGDKGSVSIAQMVAMMTANPVEKQPEAAEVQAPVEETAPEVPQETQQESETQEANEEVATPKADATTEDAEGSESTEEDVLSKKADKPDSVQKRINKAVAKQKAAEEKAAELEKRLADLEARAAQPVEAPQTAPIVADPSNPLAHVNDFKTLAQEQQQAKEILRLAEFALENEDDSRWTEAGFQYEGATFSKRQLKDIKLNAKIALEDKVPERARFLQTREQYTQQALETFPELKDKSSAFFQQTQALLRSDPRLSNSVDGLYAACVYQEGLKALEARKAASAKQAKPAKQSATPPASQTAAPAAAASKGRVTDDVVRRRAVEAEQAVLSKNPRLSQADAIQMLSKRSY
jgi:hypothetical protein